MGERVDVLDDVVENLDRDTHADRRHAPVGLSVAEARDRREGTAVEHDVALKASTRGFAVRATALLFGACRSGHLAETTASRLPPLDGVTAIAEHGETSHVFALVFHVIGREQPVHLFGFPTQLAPIRSDVFVLLFNAEHDVVDVAVVLAMVVDQFTRQILGNAARHEALVTQVAAVAHGDLGADVSLLRGLQGLHVDRATNGVTTKQRALRAAQYLDALNVEHFLIDGGQ